MKPYQDEGVWIIFVEKSAEMVGWRWTLLRCMFT